MAALRREQAGNLYSRHRIAYPTRDVESILRTHLVDHNEISLILKRLANQEIAPNDRMTIAGRSLIGTQNIGHVYVLSCIGMLMLSLSAAGAYLSKKDHGKLFLSIGALGGLYLLFSLFFANIRIFTERQRPRVMYFFIVALVLVTLILGAYAARYYSLGKKKGD